MMKCQLNKNKKMFILTIGLLLILVGLLGCASRQQDDSELEASVVYVQEEEQKSGLPADVDWLKKDLLYVSSMFTNEILVYDVGNKLELLGSIPVGKKPFHLLISPMKDTLFVTCALSDEVWQIDVSTQTVVQKIAVGKRPAHMLLSADNRFLYVSLLEEEAVAVVSLKSNTVVDKIAVGKEPYDLLLDKEKGVLYVANFGDNSISVVDLQEKKEVERISATTGVAGLAQMDDYTFLLIGGHGNNQDWREIWKYDLLKGEKVDTFYTDAKEPMPAVLKSQPGTELIWALIDLGDTVYVVDKNTFELKRKIPVGISPQAMDFNHDGSLAFVVNTNSDTITMVDGVTFQVLGSYDAGQVPTDAAFKGKRGM